MSPNGENAANMALEADAIAPLGDRADLEPRVLGAEAITGIDPWHLPAGIRLKRAFDLAFSLVAAIVLLPLWLAIVVVVKLDSPGPVLFRQRRIGRNGAGFGMFKFRTMVRDADLRKRELLHLNEAAEGLFKIPRDPRMTRSGRFLRSTSLDELPQLLNVIAGQMSIVGPRPLIPEEDCLIEGPFRRRLEMRPGMTGPWQVAGASRIPIHEMVELDYGYVGGWSLGNDLRLIVGTIPHVVRRRGI